MSSYQHCVFSHVLYLAVSQMGTNKLASQKGMTSYGTRRHLYDSKMAMESPLDQSTISLQMGTNKGASQVRMGTDVFMLDRFLFFRFSEYTLPRTTKAKMIITIILINIKIMINPFSNHVYITCLTILLSLSLLQAGMTAPGTRRHIFDKKLDLESCDSSTISLQMGTNKVASQQGMTSYGLPRQVYDNKYCTNPTEGHNNNNGGDEFDGYQYDD